MEWMHPKYINHCLGRLKSKILNKIKYLNLDVNLITTNEYEKHITISPFELQFFISNATNFKAM
jgi:hypothetical protein